MKKIFFLATLAVASVLGMTSCSDSDDSFVGGSIADNSLTKSDVIAFTTTPTNSTRAGALAANDVSSLTDFYVDGVMTASGARYFEDEKFTFANGAFSSEIPYYWPASGAISFYATNKKPVNYSYNGNVRSEERDNTAGTTDVVCASYSSAQKQEAVPLNFRHIYTKVYADVYMGVSATGHANDVIKVKSIKLLAAGKGTYTYSTTTGEVGTWSNPSVETTYSWTKNLPATIDVDNPLEGEEFFYIIPQNNAIKFKVEYEIYQNGICYEDCTGANAKICEVTTPNLKPGTSLYFSLYLTTHVTDPIKFTSTVTNWANQSHGGDANI